VAIVADRAHTNRFPIEEAGERVPRGAGQRRGSVSHQREPPPVCPAPRGFHLRRFELLVRMPAEPGVTARLLFGLEDVFEHRTFRRNYSRGSSAHERRRRRNNQ
jgi:hypothetical protein